MFLPPLAPTWCEAVAKGAKLRHVRTDLDFHVHRSGPTSAQHDHFSLTWATVGPKTAQLGPKFTQVDPSWAPLGGPGPSWAQPEPI